MASLGVNITLERHIELHVTGTICHLAFMNLFLKRHNLANASVLFKVEVILEWKFVCN